ncbi:MAG: beta-glucosidase [Rhodospirillales bacterium]|nr:beta-glucosidase [Rhodospirillales bacterium]
MSRPQDAPAFPPGFLWGAATSAYQIEGAPLADGAGPSIWHHFTHTPGTTVDGDTGDVACDHYHLYHGDIALMQRLGLQAYRFSVSWSRVLPAGTGPVNKAGVGFYDRLVDGLLAAGIQPMATLYHWDLPAALDHRGGWLNPDIAQWFADYAEVLFRALDDRVRFWVTLNEPWVVCDAGYLHGVHAPGHRSAFEPVLASRNLLRAHGEAVRRYRAIGKQRIGIAVNLEPKMPATDHDADMAAFRRADGYVNRQFLDPIFFGRYPDEMREIFPEGWVEPSQADADLFREPIDFLGINYYSRAVVRHDPSCWPVGARPVRQDASAHTALDWEIYPQGLRDILIRIKSRYGDIPLYVTENGAAFDDPDPVGGIVDDAPRCDYLRDHLLAAHDAIRHGVDLRGYFAWSLLDNLEWAWGFSKRFGLVHVDFATQQRTIKASGRLYADMIQSKGGCLRGLST